MKKEPAKRGPKPLHGENMQPRQVRMLDAQWRKCMRLGGAAWVRAQIDKAKEPAALSVREASTRKDEE